MIRIQLVMLLLAVCVGCEANTPSTVSSHENAEWDIREAVFRYQFLHNASGGQQTVDYYFLSIGEDEDPPPDFMARFADHSPKVEPASAAGAAGGPVAHKNKGGKGLIFRITSIHWIDDNTVKVEGGYYEGLLSASGNTYHVERRNGVWKVLSDEMHWIS